MRSASSFRSPEVAETDCSSASPFWAAGGWLFAGNAFGAGVVERSGGLAFCCARAFGPSIRERIESNARTCQRDLKSRIGPHACGTGSNTPQRLWPETLGSRGFLREL